jgi:hypothetical protein
MPEAILFENANFHGEHKHVFGPESNLNASDDNFFNDRVSSIAILDGSWECYRNSNFDSAYPVVLGPGLYSSVGAVGIKNDDMSSLRPVAKTPTKTGVPILGQVILFENVNFHGRHKHVLGPEPNLNASDDSFFNDRVSSVVVLRGTWEFYRDSGFNGPYPPTLGPARSGDGIPGLFPFVANVQIKNDDMSSLRPIAGGAKIDGSNTLLGGEVILFENANFHGQHKHVFGPEANLNASDDNFFNDRVSSMVIEEAAVWAFYRNSGFNGQYPRTLGAGMYPFVGTLNIQNDDMSSLRPL